MEINTNAGVLGKISEWKASLSRKLSGLSEKNAKDYLSKKHDKRIEFYQLLIDFMRSPGESNPLVFRTLLLLLLLLLCTNRVAYMYVHLRVE